MDDSTEKALAIIAWIALMAWMVAACTLPALAKWLSVWTK